MSQTTEEQVKDEASVETKVHIFVNRRKFSTDKGVTKVMTGGEIAALVDVPANNAVVRRATGPDKRELGIDE